MSVDFLAFSFSLFPDVTWHAPPPGCRARRGALVYRHGHVTRPRSRGRQAVLPSRFSTTPFLSAAPLFLIMKTVVALDGLSWWTTDATVEATLRRYGRVSGVTIEASPANGKSTGRARVTFDYPEDAAAAVEGLSRDGEPSPWDTPNRVTARLTDPTDTFAAEDAAAAASRKAAASRSAAAGAAAAAATSSSAAGGGGGPPPTSHGQPPPPPFRGGGGGGPSLPHHMPGMPPPPPGLGGVGGGLPPRGGGRLGAGGVGGGGGAPTYAPAPFFGQPRFPGGGAFPPGGFAPGMPPLAGFPVRLCGVTGWGEHSLRGDGAAGGERGGMAIARAGGEEGLPSPSRPAPPT